MTDPKRPPKRLYKYRVFSNRTLSMLVDDVIHYSDPTSFNDPLDTKPNLETDVDSSVLEDILMSLIQTRTSAEMSAAAKSIRYRGPKTIDHISRQSRKAAERLLSDIRYHAGDPEIESLDPASLLLGQYIELELLKRYNKGVFSLAERSTCPLMWSHYGDQHRGLCLGYSVPSTALSDLHKIQYGGTRLVRASDLSAMLGGDNAARGRVDDAVLLRKARPWTYEREWRLLGPRGQQDSPLELEEVVFGMRCESPVMYAIVQALAKRERAIKFYGIHEQRDSFVLAKRALNVEELSSSLPRRCLSLTELF